MGGAGEYTMRDITQHTQRWGREPGKETEMGPGVVDWGLGSCV